MLNGVFERWSRHLTVLRGLSPKSVESYRVKVEEFFRWFKFESGRPQTPITAVTRQDIEDYLEYLYFERRNGNQTRLSKLGAITGFWRFLVYEKIVRKDITADIPKPKVVRRMIQDFTRTEVIRFFKQVDVYSEKGLRDTSMLICLAFAGLRVGELCGLRLNDIVDDGQYVEIRIPEDIGKQGSSRTVDLWKAPSIFLRNWFGMRLNHRAGGTDRLFVSYRKGDKLIGNPLSEKDIDRLVKYLGQKSGLRKARVHSHMFRATHGSDLRNIRGYDIAAIANRLGHKNISTTDRYLPRRKRVGREYRSLREYWLDWERIYIGGDHATE